MVFPAPIDPPTTTPQLPGPTGLLAWLVGALATLLVAVRSARAFFASGLGDWVKQAFWDRIFSKMAKDRRKEIERAATVGELKTLESQIATVNSNLSARMGELAQVVHASAINISDVATETRDNLRLMDQGNDQHLGEMHEKVNKTREEMATVTQKVNDMPKLIVAELLTMGLIGNNGHKPAAPLPAADAAIERRPI